MSLRENPHPGKADTASLRSCQAFVGSGQAGDREWALLARVTLPTRGPGALRCGSQTTRSLRARADDRTQPTVSPSASAVPLMMKT